MTGSLEHILAGCEMSLSQYTWKHNKMLEVLTSAVENQCQSKVPEPSKQGMLISVRQSEISNSIVDFPVKINEVCNHLIKFSYECGDDLTW